MKETNQENEISLENPAAK